MFKQACSVIAMTYALLAVSSVQAQIYFWRDARGTANYSDVCAPRSECKLKWGSASKPDFAVPRRGTTIPYTFVRGGAKLGPYATSITEASPAMPSGSAPASPSTGAPSPAPVRSPIGTNLGGIAYWSPQLPFVDVMKSSSAWISGDSSKWDNGQPLDVDANGWVRSLAPGQVARKLMLREMGDRYPAGRYVVRYSGEGTVTVGFAASVVSERPGEIVAQVTPGSDGVSVTIEQTNPANYIRNISITMPGGICEGDPFILAPSATSCASDRPYRSFADHSETIIFNPVFLSRLRGYSVLRFMDWMSTNNNPVRDWLERTPIAYSTWSTSSGAPVEIMVALANVLGANPWFTIPHQADETYVERFATVVNARLDPSLVVYVEHSNEVWNSMFGQSQHAEVESKNQVPPIDSMQWHALRSRMVGDKFKSLMGSRVVTVLAAQAANQWTAARGLEYLKSRFGETGIDAVAIAPYFGFSVPPGEAAAYEKMTLAELFLKAQSSVAQSANWTAQYRDKVARAFNVRLIAYEGGQHMVGILGAENNAALNQLFDAFNRDLRIKQMYLDYLSAWKQNGGELFVHYVDISRYDKWGRWGALEYIAQPRSDAPKFDAIQTFIERTPQWWQ